MIGRLNRKKLLFLLLAFSLTIGVSTFFSFSIFSSSFDQASSPQYDSNLLQEIENTVISYAQVAESEGSLSLQIPKKIFTFWNKEPIPYFMQKCAANWKAMNPGYTITVVTGQNLYNYIDPYMFPIPQNFNILLPQYQADWIRLALLISHGGFWVDASFIMTQPLDFIHEIQTREKTENFMYHMELFTSNKEFPYFENWLIATGLCYSLNNLNAYTLPSNTPPSSGISHCTLLDQIPHSRLITLWFLEWTHVIEAHAVSDTYLEELKNNLGAAGYAALVQNNNAPGYLKQHMALQKVLQTDSTVKHPSTIGALSFPYGPFYFTQSLDWKEHLVAYAITRKSQKPAELPYFIKLRGMDRVLTQVQLAGFLEYFWTWGLWFSWRKIWNDELCGSMWCLAIDPNGEKCVNCKNM